MGQNLSESVTKARGLVLVCRRKRNQNFFSRVYWFEVIFLSFWYRLCQIANGFCSSQISAHQQEVQGECSGFLIILIIMNKKSCSL